MVVCVATFGIYTWRITKYSQTMLLVLDLQCKIYCYTQVVP